MKKKGIKIKNCWKDVWIFVLLYHMSLARVYFIHTPYDDIYLKMKKILIAEEKLMWRKNLILFEEKQRRNWVVVFIY